ncbi:hypothetical protein [Frankia sp. CiP3]|uniref:hypothetical protein n=1 Tax=Frankia sp. CiP3 TaxID=2880971 RepID=UPI001EF7336A|nr:hypothetical protein [Frankia sp. CiP3]
MTWQIRRPSVTVSGPRWWVQPAASSRAWAASRLATAHYTPFSAHAASLLVRALQRSPLSVIAAGQRG